MMQYDPIAAMHRASGATPEMHAAAEAASADLLCCPPTHHYVGETIHRRGKWGHVTYIDPRTQSALMEWGYPSFGSWWLTDD